MASVVSTLFLLNDYRKTAVNRCVIRSAISKLLGKYLLWFGPDSPISGGRGGVQVETVGGAPHSVRRPAGRPPRHEVQRAPRPDIYTGI